MAGILDQFVKELAVLSNYWFVKKKRSEDTRENHIENVLCMLG